MTATKKKILKAFQVCASSYGFKRVTMEDIASEAGMTRTALYYHFKNKEEIFVALSEWFHESMLNETRSVLESDLEGETLILKLLEARMLLLHKTAHSSPHGKDIADAHSDLIGTVSAEAWQQYRELVAKGIARLQRAKILDVKSLGMTNLQASCLMIDSAEGIMLERGALSTEEYKKRLANLVKTFYRGWQPSKS